MSVLDRILEDHPDEEFLLADGFEEAIVGYEITSMKIIYDYNKMVEILVRDGLDEIDAIEYLDYNVLGAYVGEKTPIIMQSHLYDVKTTDDDM